MGKSGRDGAGQDIFLTLIVGQRVMRGRKRPFVGCWRGRRLRPRTGLGMDKEKRCR